MQLHFEAAHTMTKMVIALPAGGATSAVHTVSSQRTVCRRGHRKKPVRWLVTMLPWRTYKRLLSSAVVRDTASYDVQLNEGVQMLARHLTVQAPHPQSRQCSMPIMLLHRTQLIWLWLSTSSAALWHETSSVCASSTDGRLG
jgi:hypothetical protein